MMFAIVVHGSSITILLISFLEFLFMIPYTIYLRKKRIPFLPFLKGMLYKPGRGKKGVLLTLGSVGISFGMLIIGSVLIRIQEIVIMTIFGEPAFQQAQGNLNQFVVDQPGIVDIILYGGISFFIIAFNEELFFRGFLHRVLGRSKRINTVLSAVLFAAYHLVTTMNAYSFVYMSPYYFVWGIVLSIEYYTSNEQLFFPIITHGLFNLLLFVL